MIIVSIVKELNLAIIIILILNSFLSLLITIMMSMSSSIITHNTWFLRQVALIVLLFSFLIFLIVILFLLFHHRYLLFSLLIKIGIVLLIHINVCVAYFTLDLLHWYLLIQGIVLKNTLWWSLICYTFTSFMDQLLHVFSH